MPLRRTRRAGSRRAISSHAPSRPLVAVAGAALLTAAWLAGCATGGASTDDDDGGVGASGTTGSAQGGSGTSTSGQGGAATTGQGGAATSGQGGAATTATTTTSGQGGAPTTTTTTSGQGGATTTSTTTTTVSTTATTTTTSTGQGGMGSTCLDNETCAGLNDVCDPQLGICDSNVQCDANIACAVGQACLAQQDMATVGACYTGCVPFGVGCAAGETCLDITAVSQEGACFGDGPAAAGQACTFHDINSGCQAGHICSGAMNPTCAELCDFWNNGSCTAVADNCVLGSVCASDPINAAQVGQLCLGAAMDGDNCGLAGNIVTGVCLDTGFGHECLEWCRMGGNDCGLGLFCTDVGLTVPVGVCF